MTKLRKSLGLVLLAATGGTLPALAQTFAPDVATQQFQAQSIIQQQNFGTQLNNLQLQQNILRDQIREQQLFAPQAVYGPGPVYEPPVPGMAFQPQPPGVALMPNRSRPAAPPPEAASPPPPTARPQTD